MRRRGRKPVLRAAAAAHARGDVLGVAQHGRAAGHGLADRLRDRARVPGSARRSARAPPADRGNPARLRRRSGGGRRGAELRRIRACAGRRRRQLCGRSDHRADGLIAGRRPRARPRRRNRDERTADRNPRGAHRKRDPRRAARLESGVRDRDRRDGAAGRDAPLGAPASASDRVASVPLAASIGRSHRRGGAPAASADGPGRGRDGLFQRPVDLDRVPALGPAVQLRHHGDRPVRARRHRRGDDRTGRRPPGRIRERASSPRRRRW